MSTNRAFANVSVEWLMKNVTQSIDLGELDLAHLLLTKLGWDLNDDRPTLDAYYDRLTGYILNEGFTKPICVYIEGYTDPQFAQGNGHHRLALAILLCLDSIPVCFSFDGEYMHSDVTGS